MSTTKTVEVINRHPHTLLARVPGQVAMVEIPGRGATTKVPEAALSDAAVKRRIAAGDIARLA